MMINLMTMEEIARAAALSVIVCAGIAGGFWISWFVYKEAIKDLRKQIKELNETMHILAPKDKDGH